MMYAQYCRIESRAGGVGCTVREFVKACHTCLNATGRGREQRDSRHVWIRNGLAMRLDAQDMYRLVTGRI